MRQSMAPAVIAAAALWFVSPSPAAGGDASVKPVFCETLPQPPAGQVCNVSRHGGALLIKGEVLGEDRIFEGGEVLVDATGLIRYVGCSTGRPQSLDTIASAATRIECAGGVISPGLINAHDHLSFDQNIPLSDTGERFDHRNDWRPTTTILQDDNPARITWSELRQLQIGTTSILGSTGAPGMLRNLDLGAYPLFDDLLWNISAAPPTVIATETIPLEGPADFTQNEGDCSAYPLYPDLAPHQPLSDEYVPHVAEGINSAAHNEFACLSSTDRNGVDVVNAGFSMIHGIALTAFDGQQLALDGASVIWSPRSNISLYGNTAPVTMLKNQGVLLSLGTDWTPSGSTNLARELACADALNRSYFNNAFSDRELWLMTTRNPAIALGVDDKLGALKEGLFGDIAIYDGRGKANPYRAIVEASPESTVLVLRRSSLPFPYLSGPLYVGSIGLFGDASVMSALPPTLHERTAPSFGITAPLCESLDVCGKPKRVCPLRETRWLGIAELGQPLSLSMLQAANAGSYSLFFCGPPDGEPTCTPMRAGEYPSTSATAGAPKDRDGDGVPDTADNCVKVFNPVRPMDGGIQADSDRDGRGDACERCPVDPDDDCALP
jgi:large repetitive protein